MGAPEPMMATLSDRLPPDDDRWAYEYKWDGVRAIVTVGDGGSVHLRGRRQADISGRYPELAGLGPALGGRTATLDGEIVAFDASGRPSFQVLQRRMHVAHPAEAARRAREVPVTFLAFDLLALDGDDLTELSYRQRRAALDGLGLAGPAWLAPPAHEGGGTDVLAASRRAGLEGVVAKRLDSRYEPGRRSRCWLKVKNLNRQEFVVGGWLLGEGSRAASFSSLVLGYYEEGGLRYAGNVGTGFSDRELRELMARLLPLRRDTSPFAEPVPPALGRVAFVEPVLVAEVEYLEWTTEGRLRAPSYKGLRDDKDARAVTRAP